MNAMESNTSVMSLLASLGQGADGDLSGLAATAEGDGVFSSLIAGLMPEDSAAEDSASLLQNLPLANQTLPPDDTALPQTGLMPDLSEDDIQTLLQQIRQGKEPLTVVDAGSEEPEAAFSEDDLADMTEESVDDDGSDILFMPQPVPAAMVTDSSRSRPSGKDAAGLQTQGNKQRQAMSAGSAADSAPDVAGADVTGTEAEGDSDFYLPGSDAPRTPALQQPVSPAIPAATTVPASAVVAAPVAATLAEHTVSDDSVFPGSEQADADLTAAEQTAAVAREKLELGQNRQEWGGVLGARIVTMVADDVQQARIQLDPPELGSLEIKLHVTDDQASVQIQTQHAHVREVLEASAHRLRDALAGQGLTLSQFDVSDQGGAFAQHGSGQQSGQEGSSAAFSGDEDGWGDDTVADENQPASTAEHSLLDTFA